MLPSTTVSEPVNARTHGLLDYGFAAVQMIIPSILGLNKVARLTYLQLGVPFLLVNMFTDNDVCLKPAINMKTHRKIDASTLAGLAMLSFTPMIRNSRKAMLFHATFIALASVNYLLTDYEEDLGAPVSGNPEPMA